MKSLLTSLRRNGLWQNNWLLGLLGLITVVNIISTAYIAIRVPPGGAILPIRFTSLSKFDQTGDWLNFYTITGLAWLVLVINTIIAASVYQRSRITSFMMMIVSLGLSLLVLQTLTFFIEVINGSS